MTVQEAIEKLKYIKYIGNGEQEYKKCSESIAIDMAIEALEKQIPKKILYREQFYGTPWLCPECEAEQVKVEFFREDGYEPKDKHSYCWKCGQKLDWGD